MNLNAIKPFLADDRFASLETAVEKLEAAVAAGSVPNVIFVASKETINRRVDEAVDRFDDRIRAAIWAQNRNAKAPWHDVMIMGAYNLPAAIKEMTKTKNEARLALLNALLPLNDLLQQAKPLIVKRGQGPKVPTKREIERAAHTMTCQCCFRAIFAETGLIAHHGYERPGYGFQTESCMGARYLPFEADRSRLGELIAALRKQKAGMVKHRAATKAETVPVPYDVAIGHDRARGGDQTRTLRVTRAKFLKARAIVAEIDHYRFGMKFDSFDDMLAAELADQAGAIKRIAFWIADLQTRFDDWKQTHRREGDAWVAL